MLDIETKMQLLYHPKRGTSWEGFALEEIIRCRHFEAEQCYFWATHQDAKLDLLVFNKGKRLGFEFKYADAPKLTKSMKSVLENLRLDELTVIYPGDRHYKLAENVLVINLVE